MIISPTKKDPVRTGSFFVSRLLSIPVRARLVDAHKDRAAVVTGRKAEVTAIVPVVKSSSMERVRPVR
jgi:hypothetical protein